MIHKLPLRRLSLVWCLLLTVPLSALATAVTLYIQPCSFLGLLSGFSRQPLLFWLNFLPVWLLVLIGLFLLNTPFFSAALMGGLCGVLSLVNRTMIEKRDEPFSPKDFALIKEAANAVQSYDMSISLSSVAVLLGFVALMVALGILFGCRIPLKERWARGLLRVFCGCSCAIVLAACVNFVYSSPELYNSFQVKSRYHITSVYEELGFPYCFCYNFNTYLVVKPENFTVSKTEAYIEQTQPVEQEGKKVNVIIVMNEAFCDVTNNENFIYPPGEEPLKNFNRIKTGENCISGHIVVPNYGAGTANTEFDVITGMQTNLLSPGGTSAFRVLNRDIDNIFRVFDKEGYHTEFIHPGQDWFYNRQNVYRYFGAQELLFSESFEEAERKGGWVTDDAVFQVMKQEFEEAVEAGENYFNYTVTIQNHMSYTADKYKGFTIPPVETEVSLSDSAKTILSVYAEGARDADAMLGNLTEYFSAAEEPVLLAFFGDHLPLLGDDYLCYRELGIPVGAVDKAEDLLLTYETPFVLWANEAAARELEFSKCKEEIQLPENGLISANYLGALVLELTGRGQKDPFFSYLNELRRKLPVLHDSTGLTGDGELFTSLPAEYAEAVQKLHFWQYYRLKVE